MDLQRLQVVITAKTQELQKQINQVANKLQNINKVSNDVENSFISIGNTGAKSMGKIVDATNQYLGVIKKIAKYNSQYDIWGGASQQPWTTSIAEIEKDMARFKNELNGWSQGVSQLNPKDTLGFGETMKTIGDMRDNILQLTAVKNELFADIKNPNQKLQLTSDLVELAKQSWDTKQQLEALLDDYRLITQINSGGAVSAEPGLIERINSITENWGDVNKLNDHIEALQDRYAQIRREIDATVDAMGGLQVKSQGLFKNLLAKLKPVGEAVKKAFKPIKEFEIHMAKVQNTVAKTLWAMEPVHKMIGRLGQGLHDLWIRVKRVLVYSTIVSFFRNIKNQISSYLSQNTELMNALSAARGAWITAFMPIYNFVVPRIIALINWLEQLGAKIATLTARIFGGSVGASKAQAKALQNEAKAAGGAAKAYEAQLAAFDELNILKEDKGGGGGGDAAENVPTFDFDEHEMKDYLTWYDWLYDKASRVVDAIKNLNTWLLKAADAMNWLAQNTLQMFRGDNVDMANAMLGKFQEIGRYLATGLNNMVAKLDWNTIGQALGAGIDLALHTLTSFITTFNWTQIGNAIATAINGMITQISWTNVGVLLTAKFNIVWQTLKGFVKGLDWQSIGNAIADALMSAIHHIDLQARAETISAFLKGLWKLFLGFVKKFNAFEFAEELFRKLTNAIFSINWIELGIHIIEGLIRGLWEMFGALLGAITGIIHGFIDRVKALFGIQSPSTVMAGIGVNIVQGLINGISQTWTNLTTWVSNAITNLKTAFSNMGTAIVGSFTTMKDGLTNALTQIKNNFSSAWSAMVENTKSKFQSMYDSIAGYVNNIGSSLSSMLSSISSGISNGWNAISNFVSNAKSKLSGVKIPKMAAGGVVSKPTVAMVGEYSGASRNPEIITPESLLRGILAESNDDLADTFISVGRQIVQAITDNQVDIRIGDDVISAAAARGDRDYKKRTGRSQFA